MAGAKVVGSIDERARVALAVGCDMLPVCNDRAAVLTLLEQLPVKERRLSSARLRALYRTETTPP